MSIDNPNVEAVKRAVGHVNRREFEQLMSMGVPGGVRHDLAGAYPDLAGEGEVRDFLGQLLQGSPDFQIHLEDAFGSGDRVCTRIRVEGTHAGKLFGQEGTGRPFSVNQLNVYRFADGKMAESWQLTDLAGFMRKGPATPSDGEGSTGASSQAAPLWPVWEWRRPTPAWPGPNRHQAPRAPCVVARGHARRPGAIAQPSAVDGLPRGDRLANEERDEHTRPPPPRSHLAWRAERRESERQGGATEIWE
ncbi:MAG: ester cyclase [Dehalococcoidia bacterium]|nr:ester cyclase [Dehalococcoidia bacterium]